MKFYRHYKNKPYKLLGFARHSETLEELALYEAQYKNELGQTWVRPKQMFFDEVEIGGVKQKRFQPVDIQIQEFEILTDAEIAHVNELSKAVFGSADENDLRSRLKHHPRHLLLLADCDNHIVGFKLGYAHDDKKFISWIGGVLPTHRGYGVAAQLMHAQHCWAKNQGFKTIETRTKNEFRNMIILNLKFNFNIIGAYTDLKGEPKLILEKKL